MQARASKNAQTASCGVSLAHTMYEHNENAPHVAGRMVCFTRALHRRDGDRAGRLMLLLQPTTDILLDALTQFCLRMLEIRIL